MLYLIWHDPWMTVARDTYLSRMLARVGWLTLPAVDGGDAGAARYPALAGDEPWLASVERRAAQLRAVRLRGARTSPRPQALCPAARVQRVDGELLELVRRPRRRRAALPARRWPTTMRLPNAPDASDRADSPMES